MLAGATHVSVLPGFYLLWALTEDSRAGGEKGLGIHPIFTHTSAHSLLQGVAPSRSLQPRTTCTSSDASSTGLIFFHYNMVDLQCCVSLKGVQ